MVLTWYCASVGVAIVVLAATGCRAQTSERRGCIMAMDLFTMMHLRTWAYCIRMAVPAVATDSAWTVVVLTVVCLI